MTEQDPSEKLSYEEARDQLVEVVHELESGNVPLSRSMELWERGERLADECQRWLDGARAKVKQSQEEQGHKETVR